MWLMDMLHEMWSERRSAGESLVALANSWLEQGAYETEGQNAGPDVSWLIHDGGGSPSKRPPWCAYFVTSLCRQAARAGHDVAYTPTGRAVSHWMKSEPSRRVSRDEIWSEDPRGLIFVRTRLSKPIGEVAKVHRDISRQGHCGIVTEIDAVTRTITCVAGNSTGWGHSDRAGSGRVAREVITEGDAAWQRLVGFIRVAKA